MIKELSDLVTVSMESFMEIDTNDLFCKNVFKAIRSLQIKESIKGDDYKENIKNSVILLKNIFEKRHFKNDDKARLFFFREQEIEAVELYLNELVQKLDEILVISKFESGFGDFMLVDDKLDSGICIERTEYQYELYLWGYFEESN